jgi:hypothetical protein
MREPARLRELEGKAGWEGEQQLQVRVPLPERRQVQVQMLAQRSASGWQS